MSAEAIHLESVIAKLEGDGSRSDEFYEARLRQANEGEPTWVPRDVSEGSDRIYDFYDKTCRQAVIKVLKLTGEVECYEMKYAEEHPCISLLDLSLVVRHVEDQHKSA